MNTFECSEVERIREMVEDELRSAMSLDEQRILILERDRTQVSAALAAVGRGAAGAIILVSEELTPAVSLKIAQAPPWLIWLAYRRSEVDTMRVISRLRAACRYAALLVRVPDAPEIGLEMLHAAGPDHVVQTSRAAEAFASLLGLLRAAREMQFRVAARAETARRVSILRSPAEARRAGYAPPAQRYVRTLDDENRAAVERALAATGGRKAAAARLLAVSRPRLDRLLRRFDLEADSA